MKRKELKAEVNKCIKDMKREVKRMNALLMEHHALLTVEDWRDIAHSMDDVLRANRTMVWIGMAGIDQDGDTQESDASANQPAPELTGDDAERLQNPELPMMMLGVLGVQMAKFADSQIQQIRETKEASWVPPALDVDAKPEGDAPAGIEKAPESQ